MLIRVEKSGSPQNKAGGADGREYEPGWSVEKIKLMGADAVKLLAPFEPGEPISAEHQFAVIQDVYNECRKYDILFLLEPVAFPYNGEKKTDKSTSPARPQTVIESARQISRYLRRLQGGVPRHARASIPTTQLTDNLHALSEASERPWVLLSAGVDYPDYLKQVKMAMECGCSGVLGGRAFWKEYFLQDGAEARTKFAATEGTQTRGRRRRRSSWTTHRLGSRSTASRKKTCTPSAPAKAGTSAMLPAPRPPGVPADMLCVRARCIDRLRNRFVGWIVHPPDSTQHQCPVKSFRSSAIRELTSGFFLRTGGLMFGSNGAGVGRMPVLGSAMAKLCGSLRSVSPVL